MLAAVTSGLTTVISWVGTVITAITGENGALAPLLPLFAIGIAISVVFLGGNKNVSFNCFCKLDRSCIGRICHVIGYNGRVRQH